MTPEEIDKLVNEEFEKEFPQGENDILRASYLTVFRTGAFSMARILSKPKGKE